MNEKINAESIQQTGIIISLSREIESVMTRLGATDAGLHDKTDHLAPKLTPECIKLLHYIGAVRNRNAHETTSMTQEDIELFVQSCESVLRELNSLSAEKSGQDISLPSGNEILQKSEQESFDRDFLQQINMVWRILAWIPFVHILYLIGGILKELKNSSLYILLTLFYFSGMILVGTGVRDRNSFFWISGLLVFGMVWIYSIILRLTDKENKLHKNFCLIPGLNLIYLCYMIRKKTVLTHFFIYVILTVLYFAGLSFLRMKNGGIAVFVILGISYIGGIVDSLFAKIKTAGHQESLEERGQKKF